jgi:hypothetical protein
MATPRLEEVIAVTCSVPAASNLYLVGRRQKSDIA